MADGFGPFGVIAERQLRETSLQPRLARYSKDAAWSVSRRQGWPPSAKLI